MTVDQAMRQAFSFHSSGKFPEAEQLYRQVLAAVPNHPIALHNLGALARQFGHHQAAVDLMTRAMTVAPSAEGYTNLGDLLSSLERIPEAEAAFAAALKLAAHEPATWANR